jgi:aminoglycoside phosphotransferase (APT) family kinase protein
MIDDIVAQVARAPGAERLLVARPLAYCLYNNRGGSTSSILVFGFAPGEKRPAVAVKLSRDRERASREHATLTRLAPRLPERVPNPYLTGECHGWTFLAMEGMAGGPIAAARVPRFLTSIVEVVVALHREGDEGPMSQADVAAEIEAPLRTFERDYAGGRTALEGLCRAVGIQLASLRDVPLPRVAQHGDFTLGNLLARPSGAVVVVDWEEFGLVRMPGYDLAVLFSNLPGHNPFADRKLGKACFRALAAYAAATRLDPRWVKVLVPVGMMRFMLFCAAEGRQEALERTLTRLESLARRGPEVLDMLGGGAPSAPAGMWRPR